MESSKESLMDSLCIGSKEPLEYVSAQNSMKGEYLSITIEALLTTELTEFLYNISAANNVICMCSSDRTA